MQKDSHYVECGVVRFGLHRFVLLEVVFWWRKDKMEIRTERLILRPWKESDAEDLYEYAKNYDDHTKNIAFLMNKRGEW